MIKPLPYILKSTLVAAALSVAPTGAYAAGAVFSTDLGELKMGTNSLTKISANSDTQSFTSNEALDNAAWGHVGSWYTFHSHMGKSTTVTAAAVGDITPGITVWRTDGAFDGGTAGGAGGEQSSAAKGTPHSFNQVGAAGDYGTQWMTAASIGGNTVAGILETIGYANDGADQLDSIANVGGATQVGNGNGWGMQVLSDGIADGIASLTFTSLMHGDYLVFVGGADGTDLGGSINLTVSQVPVPAAVYLFGSALVGLFASSRRKLAVA